MPVRESTPMSQPVMRMYLSLTLPPMPSRRAAQRLSHPHVVPERPELGQALPGYRPVAQEVEDHPALLLRTLRLRPAVVERNLAGAFLESRIRCDVVLVRPQLLADRDQVAGADEVDFHGIADILGDYLVFGFKKRSA